MTAMPALTSVRRLPALLEAEVTPDFIDENNHMNIRFYLELGALGVDALIREIGIDNDYRATRRMGVFTAEHHLNYVSELRLGEKITVHPQMLDRTDKAVHMISYLVNASGEQVANTLELTFVHVDLEARRALPMPDDITAGFDRVLAEHTALGIKAPVCGAMGVRR